MTPSQHPGGLDLDGQIAKVIEDVIARVVLEDWESLRDEATQSILSLISAARSGGWRETAEPVAWRWRYDRGEGGEVHWNHTGSKRYPRPADPFFCAIIVEPLYALPPADHGAPDRILGEAKPRRNETREANND